MDDFATLRLKMVDSQLKTEGVMDPLVLAAFGAVPREQFVPARLKPIAYVDSDIPIKPADGAGPGRYLMEPAPLARLVQAAAIDPGDTILVVGAGTGYSTAVLARLGRGVAAVESDSSLAAEAARTLAALGVANATIVTAPLDRGFAKGAPYDVILIDGAVELVPGALLAQLHDGGRLVAVVGAGRAAQGTVFTRTGDEIGSRPVFNAGIHPLPGFEKPAAFVF
jgi:protein-L-isoaspartate(D-aspartate) O-methyltransferase